MTRSAELPSELRFVVLGPIEVRVAGRVVALGGGRQLALLALLLIAAGRVVSRDRLVDELWDGDPPASAGRSLDAYVSRLRRALRDAGAPEMLATRAPGYVLRAPDTDVAEFEARVAAARDAGPADASAGLNEALALWRGRAYAEVADAPWARDEIGRLEELRLAAVEARVTADLALGRHADLIGELDVLAARHPTRERLAAQLMLALYRSGRQADALAAYQRARGRLIDALGLEPGPQLRRLEAQVLAHDPALDLPPAAGAPAAASAPSPARRRAAAIALGVAALVAGGVVIVAATRAGRDRVATSALAAQSVGALDPRGGQVLAHVEVGSEPAGMTTAGGRVWVTNGADGTLTRIDPRGAGHIDQTVRVGSAPSGVAGGFGAVWVANAQSSTVSRVDTASGEVVQTIAGAERPVAVATGAGAVWVADAAGGAIVEIDPRSGASARSIRLSGEPAGVAVGFGSVWVSQPEARRVVRLDPKTGAILAEVDVGGGAGPIAAGAGAVWVVNRLDGTLSRIDPRTEAVTSTTPVADAPRAVVAAAAGVYVSGAGGVTAIEPATGAVRRRLVTGAAVAAVTVVGRTPWVATSTPAGAAHRGGVLRVTGFDTMGQFDPAFSDQVHPGLWRATGDGLTAVAEANGGAQLVPDLAIALPRATDGGRVYRFRLRPGIRYSNGMTVRASDFRRGFEREFTSGSDFAGALGALRGAAACRVARCDLAAGVVTDDRAGTVELRLSRPDPGLLDLLAEPGARPVPPGTPAPSPARTVPGTGPFRVVRFVRGRELELARNPYFRAWSTVAQPDGYADRIVYRREMDPKARIAGVLEGGADLALDVGSADTLAEVSARHASQVRRHLQPLVVYATLNTRGAPFDDVRVRRALDLALDRRAAVRAFGGAQLATPTCQVLPPTITGHVPYCPRSAGRHDGAWHGADLRAARALVRQSGTQGMRADFVGYRGDGSTVVIAPVIVHALRQLGYRSRAVLLDDIGAFARRVGPGRFAASQATWLAGTAADFLTPFLACRNYRPSEPPRNTNAGGYCNPRFDRLLASATAAEAARPGAGARTWARADRLAVDDAAVVPVVDLAGVELLSARAGHFTLDATSQPQIDQLWVR